MKYYFCVEYLQAGKMPTFCAVLNVIKLFFFHSIEEIIFFFSDVWGKFLEFEGTCGDLASLVKVENRKLEAYREVSLQLV